MTIILGREVLEQRIVETKEVAVPAWGGSILIRKLSGTEVPKIIALAQSAINPQTKQIADPERMTRMMATAIFLSWVDEQGNQVLTDRTADIERLSKEPFAVLDPITDAINEWSGIRPAAQDEAKKSSEPTPSDDSGSF